MMKNVYSVGYGMLECKDFKPNILLLRTRRWWETLLYSEGEEKGRPIIELVNLDRLNNRNDPATRWGFDFIEGFTVISQQSRIIFPLLEPFGKDLNIFSVVKIHRTQKNICSTRYMILLNGGTAIPQPKLFPFRGASAAVAGSSEIPLIAFNVPPGSVNSFCRRDNNWGRMLIMWSITTWYG